MPSSTENDTLYGTAMVIPGMETAMMPKRTAQPKKPSHNNEAMESHTTLVAEGGQPSKDIETSSTDGKSSSGSSLFKKLFKKSSS